MGQIATFDRCSLVNKRCYNGGVLKARMTNGYLTVHVCVGPPKGRPVKVHRMVAAAFCGLDLFSDTDVHHMDDNKLNNNSTNLEAIDPLKHNSLHGLRQSNKTGHQWVRSYGKKFVGEFKVGRVKHRTRPFATAEEASVAVNQLHQEITNEF